MASRAVLVAIGVGVLAAVLSALLAPGYFIHIPPRPDADGIVTFELTDKVVDAESGEETTVWLYSRAAWIVHAIVIGLLVGFGAFFVVPVCAKKVAELSA